jgi:hypothetical protein
LHQEITVSTSYLYLHKGSSYEAETKNENIAIMMLKAAVTTMKRPSRRERQAMTAIVTISCVKFYQDKAF